MIDFKNIQIVFASGGSITIKGITHIKTISNMIKITNKTDEWLINIAQVNYILKMG